jgi:hypothetical protein
MAGRRVDRLVVPVKLLFRAIRKKAREKRKMHQERKDERPISHQPSTKPKIWRRHIKRNTYSSFVISEEGISTIIYCVQGNEILLYHLSYCWHHDDDVGLLPTCRETIIRSTRRGPGVSCVNGAVPSSTPTKTVVKGSNIYCALLVY